MGALAAASVTRPVNLGTAGDGDPGLQDPVPWVTQVGVGVLATVAQADPAAVVEVPDLDTA